MGGFPKLTILSEQLRGKTFELNKDLHTVGRIEERDICIMDPTISTYHCSFIKSGNTYTYQGVSRFDSRGMGWHKISYNGGTGWVSSRYSELH